jgi:malate dehydrogenase (oxaloacetate-decarboxylating)(NADP+)
MGNAHHHQRPKDILHNEYANKDTAFSEQERENFHLRGLLPPKVETMDEQRARAYQQFTLLASNIEKYNFVNSLRHTNQSLFFNLLLSHLEEMLPIVYTPTVGEACMTFGHIWRNTEGMYFSPDDMGSIRHILDNWTREVDIIVVTDGSRILGLGDLGANGMGIPIGKLSLYVVAAGFDPAKTLPILLDTGTNNQAFLDDPLYLGRRQKRLDHEHYYKFLDEFVMAVKDKWPKALLQFEDFSNDHCFVLLDKYRDKLLCFNDDIQGTGSVIAAGFINALKLVGLPPADHRFVFYGAGSAGTGVASAIVNILVEEFHLTPEAARKKFWFFDTKGLVTTTRGDTLQSHKIPWARTDAKKELATLLEVIQEVKPTALIGLAGQARVFTEEIVKELAAHCSKPIIFALSNPTSKAEVTAQDAFSWTEGRCIYASGSPFPPVELNGKTYTPGQGNNMYIFPGLGFGAVLARSKKVSDGMITAATKTLAEWVTQEELDNGLIYPKLNKIRDISAKIAVAVMKRAFEEKLARAHKPDDFEQFVRDHMWAPDYATH